MKKVLLTMAALAMLTVPAMAAEEPQEEACRSGKKLLEAQQRLVKFYNEWWARSGADVRGQLLTRNGVDKDRHDRSHQNRLLELS